jgi:hypothetical protein
MSVPKIFVLYLSSHFTLKKNAWSHSYWRKYQLGGNKEPNHSVTEPNYFKIPFAARIHLDKKSPPVVKVVWFGITFFSPVGVDVHLFFTTPDATWWGGGACKYMAIFYPLDFSGSGRQAFYSMDPYIGRPKINSHYPAGIKYGTRQSLEKWNPAGKGPGRLYSDRQSAERWNLAGKAPGRLYSDRQ